LRSLRRDASQPEQARTAVADIDEEVDRLNRIVSEVLDFARPIKFELAPIDLNALCEDAVRAVRATEGPAIDMPRHLDRSLAPVVTDGERVRLALVNILTNACHAVLARPEALPDASGSVSVSTSQSDGRVAIEVQDGGIGIAADDLARVFDPYFTTRRTGTGLGLAISRNIIEGLGGTITVSSVPGHGTGVRIELPAQQKLETGPGS
jgi:two-component system sensor histidine kinase HydH